MSTSCPPDTLTLEEPDPGLFDQFPQPRSTAKPIRTDIDDGNRFLGGLESFGDIGDDVLQDGVGG
jgi:hypothetical protein